MDVFALRDAVVGEYKEFATSFTTIFAKDIRDQIARIYAEERYWPEPLIQINPNYKRSHSIADLVSAGTLDPACEKIFRTEPTKSSPKGEPLSLYRHQEESIALAVHGKSFVVTTGTGSGKSLVLLHPDRERGSPRKGHRPHATNPRDHRLPDERAGQQPARGDRQVSSVTSAGQRRSPSRATPARRMPRSVDMSRTTRPTSC